jgi:hypothetical protein
MTASEIFESVTNGGSSDFRALVQILNRHGSWCLIGGLAVNCYVEPVYTLDADIVVISSQLPEIQNELVSAGFEIEKFPHSVKARMPGSDLRIQLKLDPRYQDFLTTSTDFEVLGQRVPVASLHDVVRRKIWAWSDNQRRASKRKKDEFDLMRILERYPGTRPMMPAEITALVPE